MDWITETQVKKAALKSKRAARAMSKKHWKQLYTATEDELRDAFDKRETTLGPSFCAYCVKYQGGSYRVNRTDCLDCPLKNPEDEKICCKKFREARDAFHLWNYNQPGGSHSAFVEAARLMYEKI